MATSKASAIRPSIRDARQLSGSPHTPINRHISSTSSSPFPSYWRTEEDPVIIELDPRSLRAGFQGDSGPQCNICFTPQNSRRIGDYRIYLPNYKRRNEDLKIKSQEYELWRNDIRDVDLGLVEDKLERAVREAYNKYLLVDAGVARLILVLPTLVPHPVLDTVLGLLFERWQFNSITLLPGPTMAVAAAGLRSALVVDLGWEETVVHAIYEYREICVKRSTRAMKHLVLKTWKFLEEIRQEQSEPLRSELILDFDFVEAFTERVGALNPCLPDYEADLVEKTEAMKLSIIQEEVEEPGKSPLLTINWPTQASERPVQIPTKRLQELFSESFFGNSDQNYVDDQEQPLDMLLYKTLQSVSSDVRSTCISRVIFTGRTSFISELPQKLFNRTNVIINQFGWSPVRGKNLASKRPLTQDLIQDRPRSADARHNAAAVASESKIDADLLKRKKEVAKPTPYLRQVETLGPWAGASLVAGLKSKSFVEIEKDRYLSHGMAGASRTIEQNHMSQQTKTVKAGERTSWTLAGWG